jgi:1-deoxyxylulose-5-phosphate synthase
VLAASHLEGPVARYCSGRRSAVRSRPSGAGSGAVSRSAGRPEQKVIPLCAANGISQIVWSPLAQGVLTGKYTPGAPLPADSRAGSDSMGGMMENWLRPAVLDAMEKLKPLAREAGCSLAQFALAWVLREPNVASAIVGASRPEQLDDNAAASGLEIDSRLFAEAEAVVAEI